MYLYCVRWYSDGGYVTSEGLVAGRDMPQALGRLNSYYGEDAIEDVRLVALESAEGVLDFDEFESVKCNTFLPGQFS